MLLNTALRYVRVIACAYLAASTAMAAEESPPPLPEAVSNNAVASLQRGDISYIASFSGIASGLSHSEIHAQTFIFRSDRT